ncbi:WD40 repeat domain-containing protein [Nonomuraea sp. NPDC049695]|uniref:WD40 repeat domain-containing protein n=1 Tax=Nonomuraea sp. NPDC049695 TaxID=3154734 RepID=UPI00341B4820
MRGLATLGTTLTLAIGITLSQATTATAADSLTDLGGDIPYGWGDTAVAAGKVFIGMEDRIVVTDTQGAVTATMTGVSDVTSLVAAPDGSRVYAALRYEHQVVEISPADLSIVRRFDLSAYACPSRLALSGQWLWVSYSCAHYPTDGVISLDLAASTPQPVRLPLDIFEDVELSAAGNTLLVRNDKLLRVYDIQGGVGTLRGTIDADDYNVYTWLDAVVTPDGSTAIVSPGYSGNDFDAWDLTTLTRIRSYGTGSHQLSVAVSPDGTRVAASASAGQYQTPLLVVFDFNTGVKMETVAQPSALQLLPPSLSFSGTELFAVAEGYPNVRHYYLWRLHGATLPPCKMTLTGPDTSGRFKKTTFTGQLTRPDGTTPGAQTVTVSRRSWGENNFEPLPDVTTNADGTFTFTNVPGVETQWTYKVYYDNTADSRSCSASKVVEVSGW